MCVIQKAKKQTNQKYRFHRVVWESCFKLRNYHFCFWPQKVSLSEFLWQSPSDYCHLSRRCGHRGLRINRYWWWKNGPLWRDCGNLFQWHHQAMILIPTGYNSGLLGMHKYKQYLKGKPSLNNNKCILSSGLFKSSLLNTAHTDRCDWRHF